MSLIPISDITNSNCYTTNSDIINSILLKFRYFECLIPLIPISDIFKSNE